MLAEYIYLTTSLNLNNGLDIFQGFYKMMDFLKR